MLLAASRPFSFSALRRSLPTIMSGMSAYQAVSNQSASSSVINGHPIHTLTQLKRWRCNPEDKGLPAVSSIKSIHIYDFDNTLFASPLPNKALWNGPTISQLISPDIFVNGGWWHDSSILAATGEGVQKEEPRGWQGWWNEQIVTLVELTMQQKDALAVLLTGRSESGFAELIKRIAKSRKLEFDMVCLKPAIGPSGQRFASTMKFKQELLKEIVYTYKDAEEIRIYEDRVKHTKGFRDFFFGFNQDLMNNQLPTTRKPIVAEVVQVTENATQLDPVSEVAEIQRMCNTHNALVLAGKVPHGTPPYQIKKTVFYTGYMVPAAMTDKLISLVSLPQGMPKSEIKYLSNSVLITPKPCPKSILDKVGGIGAKLTWKITGVSCFENKLWAARVEPVPKTAKFYSENPTPTIVLAIRKGGQPKDATRITNWHPVSEDQSFTFETTVGEKMMLRIEEEHANESEWESQFPNRNHAKRPREEEYEPQRTQQKASNGSYRGGNRGRGNRNFSNQSRNGRGGGGSFGRGGSNRNRGRGGQSQYKSLDDVGDRSYGQPNYEDPNSYY